MKKSNSNEEVLSRREFFKKAAKTALPIFGAIVAGSILNSCEPLQGELGCTDCSGSCDGCSGNCSNSCHDVCMYGCVYLYT